MKKGSRDKDGVPQCMRTSISPTPTSDFKFVSFSSVTHVLRSRSTTTKKEQLQQHSSKRNGNKTKQKQRIGNKYL